MQDEFSGYYNDDGNKLNPDLVPKPPLCLSCKKYQDPNEEILCTLVQLDYTKEQEFICYAYENKYD